MFDCLKVREYIVRLPLLFLAHPTFLPPQATCHVQAAEIRKGIEFTNKGRPVIVLDDLSEERR